MSRPSWNPGRRHGTHRTRSPKIFLVRRSPSTAVAIAMPLSGCRWSTCAASSEPVHRGVDRRRRAALAVQAEVERGDHLVLARLARVDVDERAEAVEAQDREAGLRERAEVTARALDPEQLDVLAGGRIACRGPSPRCCRPRSSCSADRAPRRCDRSSRAADLGVHRHAPHPACAPPTRSDDDALGVARSAGTRRSDPRAAHDRRATRRGRRGRRCRTRPSAPRSRRARRPRVRRRASASRSTSSARAVISWTFSTERI